MAKQRSSAHRPKLSRYVFIALALLLVVAGMLVAFWPRPTLVDLAQVVRGPLQVSVDEEGQALVRNPYLVAAPASGRLERVTLEVGDRVEADQTPLARLWPSLPPALDERAREQARAVVKASIAALEVAKVERASAETQLQQAMSDLARIKTLFERGLVSLSEMERYQQVQRSAQSRLEASQAAIALREAELARAEAQLMDAGPEAQAEASSNNHQEPMTLFAPIDGQVLRVLHQSETPVAAGTPILEIGDIEQDLMVEVALVSSDALRINVGDMVALDAWGGSDNLEGRVARIEPIAVTKVSALGVEEQRVRVTIDLLSGAEARPGLGHGYRLKVRIITWQDQDALIVPAAALFREDGGWAVLAATPAEEKSWSGQSVLRLDKRSVDLVANNGLNAALASGLTEGEQVVIYPDKDLEDGQAVASRN